MFLWNPATNYATGQAIGRFHPDHDYAPTDNDPVSYDCGYIEWFDNVVVGDNVFSGDNVVSVDALTVGDQLCFHGASSHDGTERSCGAVVDIDGGTVIYDGPISARGDSGGSVWAPGRGFVAVTSGELQVFTSNTGWRSYNAAVAPQLRAAPATSSPVTSSPASAPETSVAVVEPAEAEPVRAEPAEVVPQKANGGFGAAIIAVVVALLAVLGIGAAAAVNLGLL